MPHSVRYKIPASQVHKGDTFDDGEVAGVKLATKFTYISIVGEDKPRRIEQSHEVVIYRKELTPEELTAKHIEFGVRILTANREDSRTAFAAAKDKLAEHAMGEYVVTASDFDNYTGARFLESIWVNVDKWMANKPELTILDVVILMVEDLKQDLIDGSNAPTYSGGFNFHNAERQAENDAARSFVRQTRYATYKIAEDGRS